MGLPQAAVDTGVIRSMLGIEEVMREQLFVEGARDLGDRPHEPSPSRR
jgi:hypothetical protein